MEVSVKSKELKEQSEQFHTEQELFLELAACFIHDKKASLNGVPSSLEKLANLVGLHKMSAAIFEVLRVSLDKNALAEEEFWGTWKCSVIREIIFQTKRTEGFLQLYRKWLEAGVKPVVVKGIVCRSLYSKADYRTSSDEDVLVHPKDAVVCDEILLRQGFQRGELDFNNLPHEVPYRNPVTGVYIELHFSLFDEKSNLFGSLNDAFEKTFEEAVTVTIQGVDVWTPNPSYHFLYLVCHSYKHFLFSGFGIRQVCDMVVMAEKWAEQIDWEYVRERIHAFGMERFFEGLLQIGYGCLQLSPQIYACVGSGAAMERKAARALSVDLLEDIMAAGIYGSSTRERLHSANITLAAAKKECGLFNAIFPTWDYLKTRYTYVEKYPVLLPVAWGTRLGNYIFKDLLKNPQMMKLENEHADAGSSLEIGRKRVALIRKYGLIK